ncbi:TetR/AcrR family transcriptional regulator [Paractinoplanes brasiliensis]|nr:helix-turn-helix domain-containing protein [Actinoplanes brasiliensis]
MRLTRAQQQERTRKAVLAAAKWEFSHFGFADAKVDRIAERAELTRGAVYSNFPSKRSLYLAVLLDHDPHSHPGHALPASDDAAVGSSSAGPSSAGTSPGSAPPGEPSPGSASPAGLSPAGASPAGASSGSGSPAGLSSGSASSGSASSGSASPAALSLGGGSPAGGSSGGSSFDGVDSGRLVPAGLASAAEAFARVWLERLPLTADDAGVGRLAARSLTGVIDDERGRSTLAQLTRLEALLLAVALESCHAPDAGRRVRLAELIITLLHGTAHLAETAPGFGDPFDVVRACRHLAGLPLADEWAPPHLPYVAPARPVREPWDPPGELTDQLSGRPADLRRDGVLVTLGPDRLGAAEEAVRAAQPGDAVTVALVTDDPAETGALVRLRVTDVTACLRRVFGPAVRPALRLILDEQGALAAAIGVTPAGSSESAVRIHAGEIVARADGRGAGHAATTSEVTR